MSFEQPINRDNESEVMKKKLKQYFQETLEGLEGAGIDEGQTELHQILDDLEAGNFESASQYLESELERLKERMVEVSHNEIGREVTLPRLEVELASIQKLWDSLKLEEK